MKTTHLILAVFLLVSGGLQSYSFQLTSDMVEERSRWEGYLKKAEILRHEDIGEGITKPKKAYMKMGDIEACGCWKNPDGMQQGHKESWKYEIAAYLLDKYLDMGMVPPTVERRMGINRGSLQLWIDLACSELDRQQRDIEIPEEKREHCEKMLYLARAFDSLIGNIDRTQQNIRWTDDWRLILIDHSRAFRTKRLYTDQLIYGRNGLRKTMGFDRLPRRFVERVKTLDYDTVRSAVGDYLTYTEIEAMIQRKKLLLKDIGELIEEKGENAVLY